MLYSPGTSMMRVVSFVVMLREPARQHVRSSLGMASKLVALIELRVQLTQAWCFRPLAGVGGMSGCQC